jgi:hypothetical protein
MKYSQGGTEMYCPNCKDNRVCKAISAAKVTYDPSDNWQRKHYTDHKDINFFQRGRECLSCDHRFVTGEVDLEFLDELRELRDALSAIKANAEVYLKESTAASKSLSKLSESLGVLRALKIYKSAKKKVSKPDIGSSWSVQID